MPFYRQSNGTGGGGAGVSEAGSKGAATLFGGASAALEGGKIPFAPTPADEAAAAKALVEAYGGSAPASDAALSAHDALAHDAGLNQFPDLEFSSDISGKPVDFTQALNELFSNMGDMINQFAASPMGFVGSLLNFLFKLFTEVATGVCEFLSELARAAAAAAEEMLKKQMELAAAAGAPGLQPMELFNQAATTQTVSHALKTAPST